MNETDHSTDTGGMTGLEAVRSSMQQARRKASTMEDIDKAPAEELHLQPAFSHESIEPQSAYVIKPSLDDKFKSATVRDIIIQTLHDNLGNQEYDSVSAKKWTIDIANTINQFIRELRFKRYKHIVQVTIGELKGAGVKSGLRCLWDSETDSYSSEIFMNDSLWAVVVVFAVYHY